MKISRRRVLQGALASATYAIGSCWADAAEPSMIPTTTPAIGRTGKEILLPRADIQQLQRTLRGKLLLSTDTEYEKARKLWNGAFDHHPALIVLCADATDVVNAVKFVRSQDVLLAVRGGGHSISGQSGCDRGIVIDLSAMKSIKIDPTLRTAKVEPGVRLGEIDRETQSHSLITTMGTAPDTGVAGLTLGGGIGRLARKFGLACDNLLSVDLVTAKGDLLHASEKENTDLFWAIRGGGGNFGIVTMFEYRLHQFGPNVLSGQMIFPAIHARRTLLNLMEFASEAPDELYLAPVIAPNGTAIAFEMCYCGQPAEGERLIAPLRKLDRLLMDTVKVETYIEAQSRDDAGWPAGRSYYFKSGFLRPNVTASVAETIVESTSIAPPELRTVALLHVGGAAARTKSDATAYWNRSADLDLLIWGGWANRDESAERIETMRSYWKVLEPLTEGYYVNTDVSDNEQRLRGTYGGNYNRLARLKNKYDPTNLFRLNANIVPA